MIVLQDLQGDPSALWEFVWDALNRLSPKFFIRLAIDLVSMLILVRLIYYRSYRNREFFFTFFVFNLIVFLITFLLNKVEMSLGAAFGLFAVFGILRYRTTDDISIKDMTYLFLVIAMGLITAVARGGWHELVVVNSIILLIAFLLESNFLVKKEMGKTVIYENIEMIKSENHGNLLSDLKLRTGLNIHRFRITQVDFLRDMAIIRVYYHSNGKNDISV